MSLSRLLPVTTRTERKNLCQGFKTSLDENGGQHGRQPAVSQCGSITVGKKLDNRQNERRSGRDENEGKTVEDQSRKVDNKCSVEGQRSPSFKKHLRPHQGSILFTWKRASVALKEKKKLLRGWKKSCTFIPSGISTESSGLQTFNLL